MTRFDFTAELRRAGKAYAYIECEVDAEIEFDCGDPFVRIDDVIVNGVSLFRASDPLNKSIAAEIALQAEGDAKIMAKLLDERVAA